MIIFPVKSTKLIAHAERTEVANLTHYDLPCSPFLHSDFKKMVTVIMWNIITEATKFTTTE